MINDEFVQYKDPEDAVWFYIEVDEPITAVLRAKASLTSPTQTITQGWLTPGDMVAGTPLEIDQFDVGPDQMSIALHLINGVPGQTYAVRARFKTASGSILNRSVVVVVSGL